MDCINWLKNKEKVILALDMGLGKTVITIKLITEYNPRSVLIVVPNPIIDQWESEILKHSNIRSIGIYKGKGRHHLNFKTTQIILCSYNILTYDTNNTPESKIFFHVFDMVIFDEGHILRNSRTKIYQVSNKISYNARWVYLLTGTPIINKINDLYSIGNIIGIKLKNIGLEEFKESFYYRKTKDELQVILNMPKKYINNVLIQLDFQHLIEYLKYYSKCKKLYETQNIQGHWGVSNYNILTAILRLRQCANHPNIALSSKHNSSKGICHFETNKLRYVKLMYGNLKKDEKMVIVTNWTKSIEMISEIFKPNEYCIYNGSCNKKLTLEKFNKDPECRVFIGNILACGVGLNLQIANHLVLFESSWHSAIEKQAIDRIYRIGQLKNVFIHKLYSYGTIESWMYFLIREKNKVYTNFEYNNLEYHVDKDEQSDILHTYLTCSQPCGKDIISYLNLLISEEDHRDTEIRKISGNEIQSDGKIIYNVDSMNNSKIPLLHKCMAMACVECAKMLYHQDNIFVGSDMKMYHTECISDKITNVHGDNADINEFIEEYDEYVECMEQGIQELEIQEDGIQEHGIQEHGIQEHGIQEHRVQEHGIQEHGIQEHGIQELGIQEHGIQEHVDNGIQEHGIQEHDI